MRHEHFLGNLAKISMKRKSASQIAGKFIEWYSFLLTLWCSFVEGATFIMCEPSTHPKTFGKHTSPDIVADFFSVHLHLET